MRVLINGAMGAMGQSLQQLLRDGFAGGTMGPMVDTRGGDGVTRSFDRVTGSADVVLDFSFHTATDAAVRYALAHRLPLVVGTTGHTEDERSRILAAAREIPLFYTGNMSLGIAVLCKLAKETARAFPKAEVEIVEIHHDRKADAPSGTALMLARAVQEERTGTGVVCGRRGVCPRQPGEIGISSVRLGSVVGIHEVLISTGTQTITLKHEAHDRALFAEGALTAAAFLLDKPAGLYNMNDLTR